MNDTNATFPVSAKPVKGSFYDRAGKRLLDVGVSCLSLPIVVPVVSLLWVLVRLDGGQGFFWHDRVGRNGRVFRCLKLRKMVPDADQQLHRVLETDQQAASEWALNYKLQDDPRVTRLGRILRRTSLDELPQIWNILRGEMSLVGPRPITAREMFFYDPDPSVYLRHMPGLTGLWQVEGRQDAQYDLRVRMDRYYDAHRSMAMDLSLILRTVVCVICPTGR